MEHVLNPFGHGQATKVFDENEFYILFEDGLLVKKGRSKFRSFISNYEHEA